MKTRFNIRLSVETSVVLDGNAMENDSLRLQAIKQAENVLQEALCKMKTWHDVVGRSEIVFEKSYE